MMRINNNILNITDNDYILLCCSDLSNIVNYRNILFKYVLKCRDFTKNVHDKLLQLKVAAEILVVLDTKAGHYLMSIDTRLANSVNNKIKRIEELLLDFNEYDIYDIDDIQYLIDRIKPIFSNISNIKIDYTIYRCSFEYTIKV
jgi:hypothetical protein